MKSFITGGTGFLGSHLVDELLKKNHEIYCLIRKTSNLRWLKDKKVTFIESEKENYEDISDIIKEANYIFNVAGVVKSKTYEGFERGNYLNTKYLLELALKVNNNLSKFIHISSLTVSGPNKSEKPVTEDDIPNPITTYARTKLKAEEEVMKYKDKFPITIIRPPAIFGPRDAEILIYFQTFLKGLNSLIGIKEKYLSLIYVKDLVQGIMLAAEKAESNGEIFFISSDKEYSWKEISDVTAKVTNKKPIKIRIPHFVVYTVGFSAELFSFFSKSAPTLNIEKCKDITRKRWVCSNAKAKKLLGFEEKYDLISGFTETVNWYKENNWIK
jgi:dihydroflavonol-4-reductase